MIEKKKKGRMRTKFNNNTRRPNDGHDDEHFTLEKSGQERKGKKKKESKCSARDCGEEKCFSIIITDTIQEELHVV